MLVSLRCLASCFFGLRVLLWCFFARCVVLGAAGFFWWPLRCCVLGFTDVEAGVVNVINNASF